MRKEIHSILILKFSVTAQSREKADGVIGRFVHDRIYKGRRPVEFLTRPGIYDFNNPLFYHKNESTIFAYQAIHLETVVEYNISSDEFKTLFQTSLKENSYDSTFSEITDIKILQHEIVDIIIEEE